MQPEKEKRLRTVGTMIPDELIMEILLRLPVKSLLRLKLVSKPFNSLISDNHFVKLHLRRCSAPDANPLVIHCPPPDVDEDISYLHVNSFLKTPPTSLRNELQSLRPNWKQRYFDIGSCNGLVCFIGIHGQKIWVCFFNPTTRSTSQYDFILPTKPNDLDLNVYCGFGYDHVGDTYKVLFLPRNQNVLVFNMGDTKWRNIGCFPPDLATPAEGDICGVHLNGTLNWLVIHKIYEDNFYCEIDEYNTIDWDNGSGMILSFDLNKEEFVRLLLPTIPHKFSDPHLGVLGECLCVSLYDKDNFVIWQMKEFGVDSSWTKLISINYPKEILKPYNLPPPLGFPLYMFGNGDVLMLREEYVYNRIDSKVNPLKFKFTDTIYPSCLSICSESLVSPF